MSGRRSERKRPRQVIISKALSALLRHAAEREKIKISQEGYVNVADLLAWRKLKGIEVTFPEIVDAVVNSDKRRFSLLHVPPVTEADTQAETTPEALAAQTASSDEKQKTATEHAASINDDEPSHFLIRATQGHSMASVDTTLFLERLTLDDRPNETPLPDTVVHGTYHGAWPLILASGGLRSMGRTQVHFATGPTLDEVLPEGRQGPPAKTKGTVISGMRTDAEILIYINLRKALAAGCPFYRSENGVILSEGLDASADEEGKPQDAKLKIVPVEFFDVVVERKASLGILWEGGETVQELPARLAEKKNPKASRGGHRGRGRGK